MAVQLSKEVNETLCSFPQFQTKKDGNSVSKTVEAIRTNALERQNINQKISIAKFDLRVSRAAILAAAITSLVFVIIFISAPNLPILLFSLSMTILFIACPSLWLGLEIGVNTYLEKRRKELRDLSEPIPQNQRELLNEALRTLQKEIDTPPVLDTEEFQARKRQLEATRTELRSFMRQIVL